MTKKQFRIQGMHCVGCAMVIDVALEDLFGVQSASTNYAKQVTDVIYDEKRLNENMLVEAVSKAGYTAVPVASAVH